MIDYLETEQVHNNNEQIAYQIKLMNVYFKIPFDVIIKEETELQNILPPDEAYSEEDIIGQFDTIIEQAKHRGYEEGAIAMICVLYYQKETSKIKELHIYYKR